MQKNRTPLTRERIYAAALRMVDARGLQMLSMRTLAAELGVTAMALYRHAPSKAALLDGLLDLVVQEMETSLQAAGEWEEQVLAMARAFRRTMLAHPGVLPLFSTRPAASMQSLRTFERLLAVLRQAEFDDRTLVHAYYTLFTYAMGFVMAEVVRAQNGHGGTEAGCDPYETLPGDEFPLVLGLTPHVEMFGEEQYEFGLRVILDGLRAQRQVPKA